jgi:GntR family transcriptional regulator, rspAB operon transcriptional repressor
MNQAPRRRSLADEIYDQLRRMIVTLELRPGEILVEKELCERFSVSRTPLREAILRLSEHGLVVVAPQHATFVAGIDARAVRQAHFLRSNLEIPVIRQLCEAPSLDLSEARAILVDQQVLLAKTDFAAFMPLDDQFHQALFALAGLREIWAVIHARKAHLDRIRFLQAPQDGKIPLLVQEHKAILDAVAQRDPDAAEAVLRKHIAGAVLYMEELLLLRPELFKPVPIRLGRAVGVAAD